MALAVLLAITGSGTLVGADALQPAKTALAASDYPAARTALDVELARGGHGPDALAELYQLSGIVAGALGDTAAATEAFKRCLALDPKATLPPGTSPKIVRPFTTAQRYVAEHEPLRIRSETTATPPTVTVIIASDPLSMIAKVRVTVVADGAAEKTLDGTGTDRITIALPPGRRLDVRIAALDATGNRLAELGSAEVPLVIVGAGTVTTRTPTSPARVRVPAPVTPSSPRPLYLKWWVWGGVAIAFAGAGTYFGLDAMRAKDDLDALNADSQNHSFDEATELESDARRSVLVTNISLGVAGAFAVGATILYLTAPRERKAETRVTAVPVRGGGAIVLGGHF